MQFLVRTRVRLWFVLYMIGSPSLWVGCSGVSAIIGELSICFLSIEGFLSVQSPSGLSWSAWVAENSFSKAGVTFGILIVVLQIGTFAVLAA
jgi:hypothetical protein